MFSKEIYFNHNNIIFYLIIMFEYLSFIYILFLDKYIKNKKYSEKKKKKKYYILMTLIKYFILYYIHIT